MLLKCAAKGHKRGRKLDEEADALYVKGQVLTIPRMGVVPRYSVSSSMSSERVADSYIGPRRRSRRSRRTRARPAAMEHDGTSGSGLPKSLSRVRTAHL